MSVTACRVCRLPAVECICEELTPVPVATRIIILQHAREASSQSNTGSLVHHLCAGSRLHRCGGEFEPFDATPVWEEGFDHWVLFPEPGAQVVSPETLAPGPGRGRALVVLDATWRQARRMSRRIDGLRRMPFVSLGADVEPRWTLRRPIRPGQVGTGEAVARALAGLGEERAASTILGALDRIAERVLELRGRSDLPVVPPRTTIR